MVSFVCEACQETLKKQKLDQHTQRCWNAQFTCVDCSKTFQGTEYRAHTSCMTETEKYHKSVYKPTKKELQQKAKQQEQQQQKSKPQEAENIAAAPKAAPLMAQLEKTSEKRSVNEDEEESGKKKASKKSKKSSQEDETEEKDVKESETQDEVNYSKTIKAVLKKNAAPLSLSELRKKVVSKIAKKSTTSSKDTLVEGFDAAISVVLGEDGTISFQ
ncbi:hypothetical protein HDU80_000039 [Chytriomyces hyalinus]|nr:hypothetical protein HDU80_000039 [Chytriomyces hyalinus]